MKLSPKFAGITPVKAPAKRVQELLEADTVEKAEQRLDEVYVNGDAERAILERELPPGVSADQLVAECVSLLSKGRD